MTAFESESIGSWTRIRLPERVDVSNARAFVDLVRLELGSGHRWIVVDFAHTQAIDSTALGALIQVHKSLLSNDGVLRLAAVGDGVRRVLAITRVDRVFSIFDSAEAAIEHHDSSTPPS